MNRNRTEMLGTEPIGKLMVSLGIPTFTAQLINLLYNIVDRAFIGHIPGNGATALTGVGLCFPVIMFVSAFAALAGAGGAPLAGIALGAKDDERAQKILGNSVIMLLFFSVTLTLVFQIIKKPFLYSFGASDITYPFADQYLMIYLCGTIFVMMSLGLNMFITVQGEAMIAMKTVIIGAIMNTILDPVFIFVFHLGVTGAAFATVISQAVSSFWVLRFLRSEKATLTIKKSYLMPDKKIIFHIIAIGISPFIMNATESLIVVVFNRGAQMYGGDLYVGSITVLQSVSQILFVPMNGFAQGVQSIISYNYGARNLDRVKKTCLYLIFISVVVFLGLTSFCMLFPRSVSSIFCNDSALLDLCEQVMPIFLAGLLVFGLQNGSQVSFVALGKAKQSLFFALLRKVFLLTPLAIILPKYTNSVMGIYYSEPISDAISAICCGTVFLYTLRKICRET